MHPKHLRHLPLTALLPPEAAEHARRRIARATPRPDTARQRRRRARLRGQPPRLPAFTRHDGLRVTHRLRDAGIRTPAVVADLAADLLNLYAIRPDVADPLERVDAHTRAFIAQQGRLFQSNPVVWMAELIARESGANT